MVSNVFQSGTIIHLWWLSFSRLVFLTCQYMREEIFLKPRSMGCCKQDVSFLLFAASGADIYDE